LKGEIFKGEINGISQSKENFGEKIFQFLVTGKLRKGNFFNREGN